MSNKINRRVIVQLKTNVSDPVGDTLVRTLKSHKYSSVKKIRTGKVFDIELESVDKASQEIETELEQICKDILSHPVIEDYKILKK